MKIHKKSLIVLLIVILLSAGFLTKGSGFALDKNVVQPFSSQQNQLNQSTFGVGAGTVWPKQVFAPFVDITAWVSDKQYSSAGALDLAKVYADTGVLYYNLGFIGYNRSNAYANGAYGKMVDWCFGGYPELTERRTHSQYQGIKDTIKGIRERGGDIALSIGGGVERSNFFQRTQDVTILRNTYLDIINGFGLTRLDLDIEGSGQDKAGNIANAKAIKQVQALTGVQITLTLPSAPNGLSGLGLQVLDAYLLQGVDIAVVNAMTMCYGLDTLNRGESYGAGAVRAGESLKGQLQAHYLTKANVALTDKEAYAKVGTTISIGYQSASFPTFTTEWARLMYDWAQSNKVGMLSFWSLNRDSKTQANRGVSKQYEFSNIYKGYTAALPSTVKITMQSNGGNKLKAEILPYGATSADLPTPSKQGATFAGWFADKQLSKPISNFTENQTIYAKWVSNDSGQVAQTTQNSPILQTEPIVDSPKIPFSFYCISIVFLLMPFWLIRIFLA